LRPGSAEPEYRIPDAPTVGGSVRAALVDFFYNSWRLVPANAIWGAGLLALIVLFFAWPLAALPLLVVLALPAAGVFRLATLIVRERPVAFSDALSAWREFLRPALISGAALSFITLVLGTNIVIGFASAEPIGWGIATAALWGLVATWAVALPYWPLLLDPVRAGTPMRDTLRLAGALVLVSPVRFLALFGVVAIVFVASAVFFAALLTISIAFIALLLAHYTLPAADRLEQRQTHAIFR
jgi:hypothetical protein